MSRFSGQPPQPPTATDGGLLAGFDILKRELDLVTVWAVAGRLRVGQGADQIRREVPAVATRSIVGKFPDAEVLQESVAAYVARVVERELAKVQSNKSEDGNP